METYSIQEVTFVYYVQDSLHCTIELIKGVFVSDYKIQVLVPKFQKV